MEVLQGEEGKQGAEGAKGGPEGEKGSKCAESEKFTFKFDIYCKECKEWIVYKNKDYGINLF